MGRQDTATAERVVASGTRGLARPGRVAVGLWGVHVLLLFFPPIPPNVKGSLWSYLLAGASVVLATVEVRSRAPALVSWWAGRGLTARWSIVLGVTTTLLLSGLALHAGAPELFYRWSDDEGVYQPATMLAYLTAALALLAVARARKGLDGSHLRVLAGGFVLLFLEEIDYFGLIGGIVGRVDGVYVGSLHDLIHLGARGGLSVTAAALLAGVPAVALLVAWRRGHLDPRHLLGLATPTSTWWLVAGGGLMAVAQGMDTGTLGLGGDLAGLEELLEVTAAVLWLAFGLETAGGAHRSSRMRRIRRPGVD